MEETNLFHYKSNSHCKKHCKTMFFPVQIRKKHFGEDQKQTFFL